MAITDATGSVTTAWVEQDVVSFTAGTLSAIADCVAYIETKIKRGTLSGTTTPTSTEAQEEIIRAKEELCEILGFTWQRRYAYADTVAGTYRYALPPDFAGGDVRLRDLTNDFALTEISDVKYDVKFPDPSGLSTNEPSAFCIKDRELWLAPPPNAVIRLELSYRRSGDDGTATDISYVPEVLRFKICDGAVYRLFLNLHDYEKAAIFRQEWQQGVMVSKRANAKGRFARLGYRARSHLEQYSDRFYQQ